MVVLPSASPIPTSAKTTILWPNSTGNTMIQPSCGMPMNGNPQQQPHLQQTQIDPNAVNLQNSLQQLNAIIQQLNGCNAMTSAALNTNTVNTNTNLQQQQQQQHPF
mmetsp:Transcript_18776/g.39208  ORF Transcript_18776/g.39208 Transcript_18776/m.39208 type:complete len:106 (+) Transcript_18776:481-798(+)